MAGDGRRWKAMEGNGRAWKLHLQRREEGLLLDGVEGEVVGDARIVAEAIDEGVGDAMAAAHRGGDLGQRLLHGDGEEISGELCLVEHTPQPLEGDCEARALIELDLQPKGEELRRAAADAAGATRVPHRVRLQTRHHLIFAQPCAVVAHARQLEGHLVQQRQEEPLLAREARSVDCNCRRHKLRVDVRPLLPVGAERQTLRVGEPSHGGAHALSTGGGSSSGPVRAEARGKQGVATARSREHSVRRVPGVSPSAWIPRGSPPASRAARPRPSWA